MQRPNDDQLSAWLDGELGITERDLVDAWLREHPEDSARLQLWAADRDALRARFQAVLDEPIPDALRERVLLKPVRRWPWASNTALPWARAAMAAGLLLAGGVIGAALSGGLGAGMGAGVGTGGMAATGGLFKQGSDGAARSTWTQRAAVAHTVFVPEVRHPVEVAVSGAPAAEQRAQEEHLARWLTKRLDMPVHLFDLRSHGFELVGGRLLADAIGPSAQLMYQDSRGTRITVYLRRPEPGTPAAFRFHREGQVNMFYWTDEGYACALVGTLPREKLLALAEAAYQQAEAAEHGPAQPAPPAQPARGKPAS